MTNREFYTAIVTGTVVLNAGKENETQYPAYNEGDLIPELKEFAKAAIDKIDAKNEAAKGRKTTKKPNEANEALKDVLKAQFQTDNVYTAKWAADFLNENVEHVDPFTTQKTTALLRQLVDEGTLTRLEGKKGKTVEYKAN